MRFSIVMLLTQTFQLIRSDKLLLAPYIFFMMIAQLSERYVPSLFTRKLELSLSMAVIFVLGWAIELIFKQLTVRHSLHLIIPKRESKEKAHHIVLQYAKLLLGSILFMIPIGLILSQIPKVTNQSTPYEALLTFIVVLSGFSIVMILAMILSIYPVVAIHTAKESLMTGIYKTIMFVKVFFRECILFLSLTISIVFCTVLLTVLVKDIPLLGPMVLPVFIQGIGYAFIYVMNVLFYLSLLPYLTFFSPVVSEIKDINKIKKEKQGDS